MNIFVVVTEFMFGMQDEAVFLSLSAAEKYMKARNKTEGRPKIIEAPVFGDLEKPGVVYTASFYNPVYDIHIFEGIYGRYEEASAAAGERGLVLSRELSK